VDSLGCGTCGGGTGGTCCSAHFSPSCSNAAIASCVCAQDPYCCNNEWDSLCVNEVTQYGCGSCP
jgi:hypothetical protein